MEQSMPRKNKIEQVSNIIMQGLHIISAPHTEQNVLKMKQEHIV